EGQTGDMRIPRVAAPKSLPTLDVPQPNLTRIETGRGDEPPVRTEGQCFSTIGTLSESANLFARSRLPQASRGTPARGSEQFAVRRNRHGKNAIRMPAELMGLGAGGGLPPAEGIVPSA